MDNRIKFALFFKGWNFENGDKKLLKTKAEKALVTEFEDKMHDNIYCRNVAPHCLDPQKIKTIQIVAGLHILLTNEV